MKNFFFITYIILILLFCIWSKFGKSFENIQYYTTGLLDYDWNNKNLTSDNFFEYNKNKSLTLLKCCVLSSIMYSNPLNFIECKSFNKVYQLKSYTFSRMRQTFGFIALCDDFWVISIKSTSNLDDIFTSSHNNLIDVDEGEIHQGYYIQSIELLNDIYEILLKHKNIKKVYITGHSLGGTLANVIGYLLAKILKCYQICVYSYASIKFGNKLLKYNIEKIKNLKIFNIINKADMVTLKPINNLYKRIGETIEHRIDTGNDNVNHGIKVYRSCILKENKIPIKNRKSNFNEKFFRTVIDLMG
jgi:triacylglycerol lipase